MARTAGEARPSAEVHRGTALLLLRSSAFSAPPSSLGPERARVDDTGAVGDPVHDLRVRLPGGEHVASCSKTESSMLLPPYALLMPFERRAREAVKWAGVKRLGVPRPMPCGDNCVISINWHVATDYPSGWSARVMLFNLEEADMAEWFMAVEWRWRRRGSSSSRRSRSSRRGGERAA
uniref:COBRA C-terminal domain-containing protein n=1 Tax=Oryza brachyantha TaxID=4533 RepID=J3MRL3_ORYBR